MADDFMKRFAAGLNNPNIEAELKRLSVKLLAAQMIADDRVLGKLKPTPKREDPRS